MLDKPATIRDVAHQAGVSLATVSRVLNGSTTVDPVMTRRVQEVAAQLKYQPSRAARTLAGHSSSLLGLLVTDMQNPFYINLIRGVEEVAQKHGYLLIVCNTLEDPQREQQYIEELAAEPIAGAIRRVRHPVSLCLKNVVFLWSLSIAEFRTAQPILYSSIISVLAVRL